MRDLSKDSCLLTDFYQFIMAQAYFDQQRHQSEAVFHLFFRQHPFAGNWTIAAGIDDALDYVANFSFTDEAINFLAMIEDHGRPIFSKDFLNFLKNTKPIIDIFGVNDGEVIFPHEPVLRIQGPLFLCQLLETPLLNIINFQTLVATKAKRITLSARGKPVMDFGLRRAQGFDGAISATKAAFIGGITSTSNVLAAKLFGIRPTGTQAHSFVMSYEHQADAFADFCDSFPHHPVLLVDTFDPIKGIHDAIDAFLRLRDKGNVPLGIRIDSGDLVQLCKTARHLLDQASLFECKIIASGDLDEYQIEKLENSQAPIDIYGVGTRLVTAHDDPALSGVYKLSAITHNGTWRNTHKQSAVSAKRSWPGHQAIMRYFDHDNFCGDLVFENRSGPTTPFLKTFSQQELLHCDLMRAGTRQKRSILRDSKEYARKRFASLPLVLQSTNPAAQPYPVYFDEKITNKGASGMDK